MDLHSLIEELRAVSGRYDEKGLDVLGDVSIGGEIHKGVGQFMGGELDPDLASEYLVEAAGLLQRLAREVMPLDRDRTSTVEDEPQEPDPETVLIDRLVEYRRFRELAEKLQLSREEFSKTHPRGAYPEENLVPELKALQGIELVELVRAFEAILHESADRVTQRVIRKDELTVEEGRQRLCAVLREKGGEGSFQSLFENGNRLELVVTFLALLELMREGAVIIHQSEQFGDIGVRLVEGESR